MPAASVSGRHSPGSAQDRRPGTVHSSPSPSPRRPQPPGSASAHPVSTTALLAAKRLGFFRWGRGECFTGARRGLLYAPGEGGTAQLRIDVTCGGDTLSATVTDQAGQAHLNRIGRPDGAAPGTGRRRRPCAERRGLPRTAPRIRKTCRQTSPRRALTWWYAGPCTTNRRRAGRHERTIPGTGETHRDYDQGRPAACCNPERR